MAINKSLIQLLRDVFPLDWEGIHGAPHWTRVRHNGLKLAPSTGARTDVIEYFAFLHDSCRLDDGQDRHHGPRAVQFAKQIREEHIRLDGSGFELLLAALEGHTGGTVAEDITIATCWDADRLDLGRVHIKPDPRLLMTEPAREPQFLDWAWRRSVVWRQAYYARRDRV